jgi:hypothetical protein
MHTQFIIPNKSNSGLTQTPKFSCIKKIDVCILLACNVVFRLSEMSVRRIDLILDLPALFLTL